MFRLKKNEEWQYTADEMDYRVTSYLQMKKGGSGSMSADENEPKGCIIFSDEKEMEWQYIC